MQPVLLIKSEKESCINRNHLHLDMFELRSSPFWKTNEVLPDTRLGQQMCQGASEISAYMARFKVYIEVARRMDGRFDFDFSIMSDKG